MALRIIQWGTGAVGREALATILDPRSGLELVGVKVYSDDKDGVDAGTLIGRDPVGVTATTDARPGAAPSTRTAWSTPRG